ncbi:MAG: lipase family protein [Cyanothece sp. SIO2G6]|nr:lipase family protein [Cyanothece sp. SIO2G6]
MGNPITYLTTTDLDQTQRDRSLLLVEASIQAYCAYDKRQPAVCNLANVIPPQGYEIVDCWTGVDAIFGEDRTVECYGVVFRSQQPPYTYIFAFRGTDSFKDLLDDFAFNFTAFKPYEKDLLVPSEVKVESGFYRIYSDADNEAHVTSMQAQVFALVDKYAASDKPIHELCITGHSLGCTLSTLFTLDLALSRPHIKNVISYNYASPRVGNAAFVEFYEKQDPQKNSKTRTLRIQNLYDKVPCVPLKRVLNHKEYQHLSYAYLVSFYRKFRFDFRHIRGKLDIRDNHSVKNYQTVLACAFKSTTGYCEETFDDGQGEKIISVKPKTDPSIVCNWRRLPW